LITNNLFEQLFLACLKAPTVDDLIIGAIGVDINGSTSGSSYVVFGREQAIFKNGFED